MPEGDAIQGDLQQEVMTVLWRIRHGTVEDVRGGLPKSHRRAYTTIQTVLNRLVDRGLLEEEGRQGVQLLPPLSEADYVSRSLDRTLADASDDARLAALATLVGGLDEAEMKQINSLAREISDKRRRQ